MFCSILNVHAEDVGLRICGLFRTENAEVTPSDWSSDTQEIFRLITFCSVLYVRLGTDTEDEKRTNIISDCILGLFISSNDYVSECRSTSTMVIFFHEYHVLFDNSDPTCTAWLCKTCLHFLASSPSITTRQEGFRRRRCRGAAKLVRQFSLFGF